MDTEGKRPFAPQRDWDAISRWLKTGKNAVASRSTAADRFRVYASILETVMVARRSIAGRVPTDQLRFAEKLALRKRMNIALDTLDKSDGE